MITGGMAKVPDTDDAAGPSGILIVDDEEPLRMALRRVLSEEGFSPIYEASNGVEALGVLQQHDAEILVVLLDLRMPKMDGMSLMKHLVNVQLRPVGVILLTAHNELMSMEEFFSLGTATVVAAEYLVKPYNVRRIAVEVGHAAANIRAKRRHLSDAAVAQLGEAIATRLQRLETRIDELGAEKRGFLAELGMDLIRALLLGAALLLMLRLGLDDFIRRLIGK